MSDNAGFRIALPEINRDKHSLFATNAASAANWLHNLPRANLGESTRQLYQALAELNHVRCKGKERFDILESLRRDIHSAIKGLSQHYLSKPIVLSDKVEKIVLLADTLNAQLAMGYCQAYIALDKESRLLRPGDAMATCLHRALTEYGCMLVRRYQLHRSPPDSFWLKVNSIFQVGLKGKLRKHKIADKIHGDGTITQAYLRPLLLSRARPHQMPQRHIAEVFAELAFWTGFVELRSERLESCVFLLNPAEDMAPAYRELINQAPSPGWLGIDTRPLTQQGIRSANDKAALPLTLIDQLKIAWSASTNRAAERIPCDEPAHIALGLGASHFYLAGECDFDTFRLDSDEAAMRPAFGSRQEVKVDPWSPHAALDSHSNADDTGAGIDFDYDQVETINYSLPEENIKKAGGGERHQYVESRILDISNSGYRIEWPESAAMRIRNGEIIAVRSQGNHWQLAAIRWMRSDEIHQIGVEILATDATAYSARIVQAGLASSDYQRALMLPGGDYSPDPTVILAAVATFATGQTVELLRPGQAMRVKLTKQLEASNAYKVFEYEEIQRSKRNPTSSIPDKKDADSGDFNNVWELL